MTDAELAACRGEWRAAAGPRRPAEAGRAWSAQGPPRGAARKGGTELPRNKEAELVMQLEHRIRESEPSPGETGNPISSKMEADEGSTHSTALINQAVF